MTTPDLPAAATHTGSLLPKLVTTLREGYGLAAFRADFLAGLTVAVIALPLSMAIAIASGAKPEQGLISAIIGGFVISALGGTRFQIGGPAGAFIVVVAGIIGAYGYDGLMTATFMAGAIILILALLRLGTLIQRIPHEVVIGFTAAIAVIIAASQLRDFFGLKLSGEPGPLIEKVTALWQARGSFNPAALALAAGSAALILALRRWQPLAPGALIAIAVAALLAHLLRLPVETIGGRFGVIAASLPMPHLPPLSVERCVKLLPSAFAIALLGSIESLLSAVAADKMTGRQHRSNSELLAQGVANLAVPLFGGICATGTIARTAANIRARAHGPVAGMLHAVFVLACLLFAGPVIALVPLAALAGVLAVVAWTMADRAEVAAIITRRGVGAAVLLATFAVTLFVDLISGIVCGCAVAGVGWWWRRRLRLSNA